MKRKSIFLVIAMLILVLTFVACNRDGGTGAVDAPTQAVDEPPAPPPEQPPAPEADDPTAEPVGDGIWRLRTPVDMGGRTLVVASDWGNGMPYTWVGRDEPDPATAGNYFIDRLQWNNAQRVFADYNFNFEYVHIVDGGITAALTASVMAGDPIGDLVFLGGGGILSGIVGDLIRPASVAYFPGSDIFGPQIYGRVTQAAFGEPWAFYYTAVSPHVWMMGVNLDIINAIGAPNPVDLYNEGRWTWDAALEIMRMATRDTTGDGVFDQWGIAGQPGDLVIHFIATNDGPLVDDDLNYAFDHPNTLAALELMETIFREGLWQYDPVLGVDPGDWARNFFAFQEGRAALFKSILWGMNDGDLPFEFAVIPFPTGPNNTSGATWSSGWGGGLTIPYGTSWEPSDMLRITEAFLSWPGEETELIIEGGLGWPRGVLPTEEDVQRWAANGFRARTDIGRVVPQYYWVGGTFTYHFANQTMNVMQVVEAYRAPQQELLDLFFGR